MINNLEYDNLDERSDIISRVDDMRHKLRSQQSLIESKSNYSKSPTRLRRRQTNIDKYNDTPPPQIIEEDVEQEQQLETGQL